MWYEKHEPFVSFLQSDETNTLYHQADVSLSLLKGMLKEREQQLKNMFDSIEQAQTVQEKLEKEKNECIKSSLERETMYKSLLAANSSQVGIYYQAKET